MSNGVALDPPLAAPPRCIGALLYISTVLLLPAIVWLAAFKLMFPRQLGDPYDVWAAGGLPQAEVSPPAPPPTGETLPQCSPGDALKSGRQGGSG